MQIYFNASLFGAVKLTKNAYPGKYSYYGFYYGIWFDARGTYSLSHGSGFGKNVIIFWVDKSSSVHGECRKTDMLILRKGPTEGLDDTTITIEAEYSISFSKQGDKLCLSTHCNVPKVFWLLIIYQFKTKDSELSAYELCLGNISKVFYC